MECFQWKREEEEEEEEEEVSGCSRHYTLPTAKGDGSANLASGAASLLTNSLRERILLLKITEVH